MGWKCSSGRRSEVPPRGRKSQSISDALCPAFPQPSAFAWQTGRCRVRSLNFPVRESAAFACIVVVTAIPNTSLCQGACAPVLSPATSLVRCLRGAAKMHQAAALQSIQCSLPDRRLGSKWRTFATEEPRTRCESSYSDARSLIRFLPRLVHQRALENNIYPQ